MVFCHQQTLERRCEQDRFLAFIELRSKGWDSQNTSRDRFITICKCSKKEIQGSVQSELSWEVIGLILRFQMNKVR